MSTMTWKTIGRALPTTAALVVMLAGMVVGCGWSSGSAKLVHEPVSQTLDGATRADIEIAVAVGRLRIGALDQPSELISGEIAYPERHSVTRDFAVQGDTASFALREQDGDQESTFRFDEQTPVWDLRLSQTTPLRLVLETGVGESVIDLAELAMTDITLKSGVGSTTLTLPRAGQVRATVEGGVGVTTIRVPSGVGVQLKVGAGLGNTKIPTAYRQQGDVYTSPDYQTAAARVDLQANTGIGAITVEQLSN